LKGDIDLFRHYYELREQIINLLDLGYRNMDKAVPNEREFQLARRRYRAVARLS